MFVFVYEVSSLKVGTGVGVIRCLGALASVEAGGGATTELGSAGTSVAASSMMPALRPEMRRERRGWVWEWRVVIGCPDLGRGARGMGGGDEEQCSAREGTLSAARAASRTEQR